MPVNRNPKQPKVVKRILCLANSRKLSGRCLAGREIVNGRPGPWIRPVSDREHEEVSEQERQYENGNDPKLLDVIDVPLLKASPHAYQQENWLLDPKFYWARVSTRKWEQLQKFVEPDGPLWINGNSSTNGLNDRIFLSQSLKLQSSLRLIHITRLIIVVSRPGAAFGDPRRRVYGWFKHDGTQYRFSVTDPIQTRRFLAKADGQYKIGECCLTISLGEAYKGYCYKLIAAIIERAQIET